MSHFEDFDLFQGSFGVSLDFMGLDEFALCREDAIRAIEILRDSGSLILGGDVYVSRGGVIESTYANWHVDPINPDNRARYLSRSWEIAEQYIKAYPEPENGKPLFVIVPDRFTP